MELPRGSAVRDVLILLPVPSPFTQHAKIAIRRIFVIARLLVLRLTGAFERCCRALSRPSCGSTLLNSKVIGCFLRGALCCAQMPRGRASCSEDQCDQPAGVSFSNGVPRQFPARRVSALGMPSQGRACLSAAFLLVWIASSIRCRYRRSSRRSSSTRTGTFIACA